MLFNLIYNLLVIVLGLSFGSFLNVLIHRLPKEQSIVFPASYCPRCKKSIKWFHNIPIISFILLIGISNCCKNKISLRYPLVEFISLSLWIWSFYNLDIIHNERYFGETRIYHWSKLPMVSYNNLLGMIKIKLFN